MAASSNALNLAAAYFAQNEDVDTVLISSDGNVFQEGEENLSELAGSKLEDTEVYEVNRDDEGMSTRITNAVRSGERTHALTNVVQAVNKRASDLAQEAAEEATSTYAEQLAALTTALEVSTFTAIPATMTINSQSLTRAQVVIATWYNSGMTVDEWNDQDLEDRVAAVTAAFTVWVD